MTKIKNFFKSITNSKKKVFALALSVCVVVLSIAGSSIAYFTDTAEYTNTFTSGNVDIALYVNDEDFTNEAESSYTDSVIPGKTVEKITVIKNTGSESAYIGAVITLTIPDATDYNITDIINSTGDALDFVPVGVATLLDGLVANGADYKVTISPENKVITIRIAKNEAVVSGGTVKLFDNIVIPSVWDNAEMDKFENVEIDVKAYAVQSVGNEAANAWEALQDAFGTTAFPS